MPLHTYTVNTQTIHTKVAGGYLHLRHTIPDRMQVLNVFTHSL